MSEINTKTISQSLTGGAEFPINHDRKRRVVVINVQRLGRLWLNVRFTIDSERVQLDRVFALRIVAVKLVFPKSRLQRLVLGGFQGL